MAGVRCAWPPDRYHSSPVAAAPTRRHILLGGAVCLLGEVLSRHAHAEDVAGTPPSAFEAQARWISGEAPLPSLEPSAEWKAYAQGESERWQLAKSRVAAMRDWSTREVQPLLPPSPTVFYPFAGPDALHALALFGGAKRLVLVGLEPVGALPDPAKPAAGVFTRLGAALNDVHRLTFFRTREMSTDFQREGVVGAIVATMARMGARISGVQITAKSARVDYADATTGQPRRLDYIQADLANFGLKQTPQLVADLRAMAPYVSFVKAAMYLLHETRFSSLRQAMLDDSAVLLQDDTGIPYRYFDEHWALRLYGKYEKPVTPFEERYQPMLQSAYESKSPNALSFGIGYHVQPQRSNLLVASKASTSSPRVEK